MRARNRLLNEDGRPDGMWLATLEQAMATHGAALDSARRQTVAALDERLRAGDANGFARAGLALEGGASDGLAAALAAGRARDAAAGRALVGPHRADLVVTHLEKGQAAALSSTGEQKALLFAIVLGHAALVAERTGRPPVLLLDEVAAHLDARRRSALFAVLDGIGQVWMTGTEPTLFAGLPDSAARIHVGPGGVTRLTDA